MGRNGFNRGPDRRRARRGSDGVLAVAVVAAVAAVAIPALSADPPSQPIPVAHPISVPAPATPPPLAGGPAPDLDLLFTAQVAGWVEPCG